MRFIGQNRFQQRTLQIDFTRTQLVAMCCLFMDAHRLMAARANPSNRESMDAEAIYRELFEWATKLLSPIMEADSAGAEEPHQDDASASCADAQSSHAPQPPAPASRAGAGVLGAEDAMHIAIMLRALSDILPRDYTIESSCEALPTIGAKRLLHIAATHIEGATPC
jgi:hypothetical protein